MDDDLYDFTTAMYRNMALTIRDDDTVRRVRDLGHDSTMILLSELCDKVRNLPRVKVNQFDKESEIMIRLEDVLFMLGQRLGEDR